MYNVEVFIEDTYNKT